MKTSTLESKFLSIWERRHLLGGPAWVAELPEPERERTFHPVRKWRLDFAWPAYRVGVEIEGGVFSGGRHARATGIQGDIEKSNAALELGWRILRFTAKDLTGKRVITTIQAVANLLRKGKVAEVDEQLSLFT